MAQIIAWKCDEDGKVFEDKTKYQNHLRKLARHRLIQRKLKIDEAAADAAWEVLYQREYQSPDEWFQMVIENQDMFWAEAAKGNEYDWEKIGKIKRGKVVMPVPRLLEFKNAKFRGNTTFTWSTEVCNSHNAPKGYKTNWGGYGDKDGVPRSYPGWIGSVTWLVEWPKEFEGIYPGSDLFRRNSFDTGRQRAHTGSGGGGGMHFDSMRGVHVQEFGYDFRLFAADWPGMFRVECLRRENEKRKHVWQAMGGKGVPELLDKLPDDYVLPDPITLEGW